MTSFGDNKTVQDARLMVLYGKSKMNETRPQKANAVEFVLVLGKIKPCGFTNGSYSDNHTPLRGER